MSLREQLEGKRFGLVLSAGYFGFFGHAGFVEGLREVGLKPAAWAGTSAGALVAAFCAAGMPVSELLGVLTRGKRDDFWDPDWFGIARDALRRGHRTTGLLRGRKFRALLDQHLPRRHFEECEPLVLVATDVVNQTPAVLDRGDLASAVHASCAYPGMFQAVERDGSLLWDGGIVDKAPALALADHAHGAKLEALLVHHLPTRSVARPRGPLAYAQAMSAGVVALRKDHFRLQLEVLRARGLPVHVVTSHLPKVSPTALQVGAAAARAGKQAALKALS